MSPRTHVVCLKGQLMDEKEVAEREGVAQDAHPGQEAPQYSEIAAELKKMGTNLKEAFEAAIGSEKSKMLQSQAQDAFESLIEGARKLGEDAKSGALERNAREGLYNTIQNLNKNLEGYSESAKSEGPSELEETAESARSGEPL